LLARHLNELKELGQSFLIEPPLQQTLLVKAIMGNVKLVALRLIPRVVDQEDLAAEVLLELAGGRVEQALLTPTPTAL